MIGAGGRTASFYTHSILIYSVARTSEISVCSTGLPIVYHLFFARHAIHITSSSFDWNAMPNTVEMEINFRFNNVHARLVGVQTLYACNKSVSTSA